MGNISVCTKKRQVVPLPGTTSWLVSGTGQQDTAARMKTVSGNVDFFAVYQLVCQPRILGVSHKATRFTVLEKSFVLLLKPHMDLHK